jgi:hypothetical protein
MCGEFSEFQKAQPAKGLPKGWKFFSCDPSAQAGSSSPDQTGLAGLVLVSPGGRRYARVESALASNEALDAQTFCKHVGWLGIVEVQDHALLGKGFRQDWVDVKGNRKVVYGRITGVHKKCFEKGILKFTITFNEKSRALANAGFSDSGVSVPIIPTTLSDTMAYGACLALDPNCIRHDAIPFHWSWLVPEARHEDFVLDHEERWTPRLTLHFRGFHIELTAKQSTIPNAGKGVFVSCTSLLGDSKILQLNAGELLDFGVYAPFRREDNKALYISLLKNFVHGGSCEEWHFDNAKGDQHVLDITDDATGKLHELAARHIPAYVNETDGHTTPTVFAAHDPEGAVHYLLGHHLENDGPFTIPADGTETEIFIDYGESYENVRVRKNYSREPPAEATRRLRHLEEQEQIEYLDEFQTYTATEITECVDFLIQRIFCTEEGFPVGSVARGMLAATVCRKVCERYLDEFSSDELNDADACLNGFTPMRMQKNIKKCQKLILRLFASCNNWATWKDVFLSHTSLLRCLEFVLGELDYEAMPPAELGDLIVGTK